MNGQRTIAVTAAACSLIAFYESSAAEKSRLEKEFIPAGKWVMSNGDAYCVPTGNRAPDPIRLAAEVAASSSTGDYRWVGECKILKYSAQTHSFSTKLSCSQKSERSRIKTTWIYFISGSLNGTGEYNITEQIQGIYKDTTTYRKISDTCALNSRQTIIGRKTSIAQPLNPLLEFLAGLPEGTETNIP